MMRFPLSGIAFWLAASLAVPLATSSPARAEGGPTAATKAELQRALEQSVTRHVARTGLGSALRGYALAPAIVQLRRYAEPTGTPSKVVCIVSLVVKNQRAELLAEVRGSASALGGSTADAVDAAVGSAMSRMPEVLGKLPKEIERVASR